MNPSRIDEPYPFADLKARARAVLKQTYWTSFFVGFLSFLITLIPAILFEASLQVVFLGLITLAFKPISLLILVLMTCVRTFLANPVRVGVCRFYIHSRFGQTGLSVMFQMFS